MVSVTEILQRTAQNAFLYLTLVLSQYW